MHALSPIAFPCMAFAAAGAKLQEMAIVWEGSHCWSCCMQVNNYYGGGGGGGYGGDGQNGQGGQISGNDGMGGGYDNPGAGTDYGGGGGGDW